MLLMIMLFYIFLIIMFIMLFINFILSKNNFKIREKLSTFECGFDSQSNKRLPFSLQFFLIAIIFLIFDVEIALIFPMIKLMNFNFIYLMINSMIILLILIIGLFIEWKEGSLNWFK